MKAALLMLVITVLTLGEKTPKPCRVDISGFLFGRCHVAVAGYIVAACR